MLADVEFSDAIPPLAERQAEFEDWVRNVREPARSATEGLRRIRVSGAEAEYEIAPLPSGRWAVRMRASYLCGNGCGQSSPWSEHAERSQCIDAFLALANRHFNSELSDTAPVVNQAQHRARRDILAALNGGLFGFIEPDPERSS